MGLLSLFSSGVCPGQKNAPPLYGTMGFQEEEARRRAREHSQTSGQRSVSSPACPCPQAAQGEHCCFGSRSWVTVFWPCLSHGSHSSSSLCSHGVCCRSLSPGLSCVWVWW